MHINQNEKREQDHVLDNLSQRIYADRQTQDANASVEQKAALINDQARRHPYRLATPTTPPRIGEKKTTRSLGGEEQKPPHLATADYVN